MMENANFGSELTIDFKVDLEHINDKEYILEFLRELIKDVDMEIHVIDNKKAILIDTWAADEIPATHGTSCCIVCFPLTIQELLRMLNRTARLVVL